MLLETTNLIPCPLQLNTVRGLLVAKHKMYNTRATGFPHMAVVCNAMSLFVLDTRDCDSWVNGTWPNLAIGFIGQS